MTEQKSLEALQELLHEDLETTTRVVSTTIETLYDLMEAAGALRAIEKLEKVVRQDSTAASRLDQFEADYQFGDKEYDTPEQAAKVHFSNVIWAYLSLK
jgi:hypothetical protein